MLSDEKQLTWKDVVRNALIELGGQGHLSDINRLVKGHPKTKTNPTWKDTIRRVVRQYKIFEPIPPERSGIYKVVETVTIEPQAQVFSQKPEIDHGIAQGMLTTVGRIYGYETYVPPHDQTIRKFQGRPLAEHVTVSNCDDVFLNSRNLTKIRQIDAIWFDEDDDGLFPRYAFEVEQTTQVKPGLDRLLKIPKRYSVQLFIIAPSNNEKKLFEKYTSQTPFRSFEERFRFKLYNELELLYNAVVKHNEQKEKFGVFERWKEGN